MGNEDAPTFASDEFMVSPEKPQTRPGAVIVLLLAVIGGGGYLFHKHGPTSANAASRAAIASGPTEAQKNITEFLAAGGKDITAIKQGLQNTEEVVKQFNAYPSMTQVPLSELRSNPFRSEQVRAVEGPSAPTMPPLPTSEEEARAQLAARKQKGVEAIGKLKVESILSAKGGGGGTAIINGELVRVGSRISGFTVESIKPGLVVVTDGVLRFERRLAQ